MYVGWKTVLLNVIPLQIDLKIHPNANHNSSRGNWQTDSKINMKRLLALFSDKVMEGQGGIIFISLNTFCVPYAFYMLR